ncbi:DNA modification methylase [Microbacterium pygmaeum]|uniref:DNA modification methylase n=1 Tax=Microbacterium pygmaeum TaxID=370764 RepID=A0A1G7Y8Z9_9MICO|nr:DNA modification methylase [Microbacterium pygmaeum]SDG92941.1 hypothetical protein SAMN04489810_1675 [Microbacterium pygmaeum]
MKSRLIASLAIGALVVFGTSGCAMLSTQATTIPYSPADGVNVPNGGPLEIRNVLIVANEEGTEGNLVAAIVNTTDKAQTLSIEYGDGGSESIRVRANEILSLGTEDTDPLLLEDIDTMPGADIPMYFQSGDAEGVTVAVPVLDGSLSYLSDLVP